MLLETVSTLQANSSMSEAHLESSDQSSPGTARLDSDAIQAAGSRGRASLEPMDAKLTSIQPGGGVIIKLELAWGRLRRWSLRTFRPKYVERMRGLRHGATNGCPHEVLDPRDLKFYRNQNGYFWNSEDDRFAWRDRLPFTRDGLAELMVFSLIFFGSAGLFGWLAARPGLAGAAAAVCWLLATAVLICGLLIVWFFRDPNRTIPNEPGLVVSPADGKVVTVEEVDYDEFIGGPAVLIGIFLSIFSVHVNRAPVAGRVIGLRYREGKCLNALRPESARENEQLAVRLEAHEAPYRRMIVRQITGAIARRIVCGLKPGDELKAGERFGMIKLGSRTELVLPREDTLDVRVVVGETVQAGSSVVAVYRPPESAPSSKG